MAEELLPCPFCGSLPWVDHIEPHTHSEWLKSAIPTLADHHGSYTIECTGCAAGFIDETFEAVKAQWNRRT